MSSRDVRQLLGVDGQGLLDKYALADGKRLANISRVRIVPARDYDSIDIIPREYCRDIGSRLFGIEFASRMQARDTRFGSYRDQFSTGRSERRH
jgi:hypothetical protein